MTARAADQFASDIMRIKPKLITYARKFTPDAEELVSQSIYKALKSKDQFQPGTNMKAWMKVIIRNEYINQYRREKKMPNDGTVTELLDVIDLNKVATNSGLDDLLESETWQAVNSLQPRLALPFRFFLLGYKYDEIAKIIAEPIGTVKSKIHHAKLQLQKQIIR